MAEEIPEELRDHFGHDKVACFGTGPLPAAPPAPPGSPARNQGEAALRDALSKVGTPGRRPGDRPAAAPPRPKLTRAMRLQGERALFEDSMRRLGGRRAPHPQASWLWRTFFVPVYRRVPWGLKRRMVAMTSGVRRWRT